MDIDHMRTVFWSVGRLFLEGRPRPTVRRSWRPSEENTACAEELGKASLPVQLMHTDLKLHTVSLFQHPSEFSDFFFKHSFNIVCFFLFQSKGAHAVY